MSAVSARQMAIRNAFTRLAKKEHDVGFLADEVEDMLRFQEGQILHVFRFDANYRVVKVPKTEMKVTRVASGSVCVLADGIEMGFRIRTRVLGDYSIQYISMNGRFTTTAKQVEGLAKKE